MTPEQAQINLLRKRLNQLLRQVRCGEVLYSDEALSGTVPCNYKLGVDNSTGDLYYKDENNEWQLASSGGGGGGGTSDTVMIFSKIGEGYTIQNSANPVTGLDDGSSEIQSVDFEGKIVHVILGNIPLMPEDASDGDTFYTKALGDDTIVLSEPLVTDNKILIFVFGDGGSGITDTNFANSDLTFDADRTHDANNQSLSITNIDSLTFDVLGNTTINSTTGGLLIPRLTEIQRDALSSPDTSLLIFNVDDNEYQYYDGSDWQSFGGATPDLQDVTDVDNATTNNIAIGANVTPLGTVHIQKNSNPNIIIKYNQNWNLTEDAQESGSILGYDYLDNEMWSIKSFKSDQIEEDALYIASASRLFLISANGQPLIFNTEGVDRMLIDMDGNVGIGTPTPTKTLEVKGEFRVSDATGLGEVLDVTPQSFKWFSNDGATQFPMFEQTVTGQLSIYSLNSAQDASLLRLFLNDGDEAKLTLTDTKLVVDKQVGIGGTSSPDASAKLQINSTTQGFLPPRMTGAQAEAISSPAEGLMVFITNGNGSTINAVGWWGYASATWQAFALVP